MHRTTKLKGLALFLTFAIGFTHLPSFAKSPTVNSGTIGARVIYGIDNRKDVFEVQDQTRLKLAAATVALVDASTLTQDPFNAIFHLKADQDLKSRMNLCPTEPFLAQPSSAFCSGFLIDSTHIATAGHCISSSTDCENVRFVFGFKLENAAKVITDFSENQIYKCARIAKHEYTNRQDYSVIELDRAVEGIAPLKLRTEGELKAGDELMVIGHPSGIPAKIADGGIFRKHSDDGSFFVASLDTYGGNSGSAVINVKTNEVEGILVRGENDYVRHSSGACYVSNVCPQDGCRGEDVTNISYVTK